MSNKRIEEKEKLYSPHLEAYREYLIDVFSTLNEPVFLAQIYTITRRYLAKKKGLM